MSPPFCKCYWTKSFSTQLIVKINMKRSTLKSSNSTPSATRNHHSSSSAECSRALPQTPAKCNTTRAAKRRPAFPCRTRRCCLHSTSLLLGALSFFLPILMTTERIQLCSSRLTEIHQEISGLSLLSPVNPVWTNSQINSSDTVNWNRSMLASVVLSFYFRQYFLSWRGKMSPVNCQDVAVLQPRQSGREKLCNVPTTCKEALLG